MKEYVKPELFYEDFELSQHIAGCYLTIIGLTTIEACRAEVPETGTCLFTSTSCGTQVENPEDYCYTNGPGQYNTFLS